jgi:phosphoribosylanthranilate isomerase
MIKGTKICGVSDFKTLNYILNHPYPPKFIGFICNFKKSKRYVPFKNLKSLINIDKKNSIYFVSVLVNPNDEILEKLKILNFDYYQLYDVTPERTIEIKNKYKIKIISAITVSNLQDVEKYKDYSEISDIILFDSKGYHKSESFDHNLLKDVPDSLNKMIAGDIQIENIVNLKGSNYMIDISGALEDENGKKDLKKIDKLLNIVNLNMKKHD